MCKTIQIIVKYMVNLKDQTGQRQEQIVLPSGSCLQDALTCLNKKNDLELTIKQLMILLNGKGWQQYPDGLNKALEDGDTLILSPIVCGG